MTDQLAAAPTPGPWEVSINPDWEPHNEWAVSREITIRPVGEHPHGLWIADCGLSVNDENMANAHLIAAAPATAAERDRLKVVLDKLVRRLDRHFGGPDRSADWQEQTEARAVLNEAHKL